MLTPAEQKQIREALCAIVVRGLRYPTELTDVRNLLTAQFLALKAETGKQAVAAK
jgi:hypothetical protein